MKRGAPLRGSVVLLSGGMDSATCLALATRDQRPVHALSIVYGQRHARELTRARALARHYRVRHHEIVRLPIGSWLDSSLTHPRRRLPRSGSGPARIPSTYVPARNTLFLSLALAYAESHRLGAIYLGANAIDYSGYPDCRPQFLTAFEGLARRATRIGTEEHRSIRIRAPLLRLSKARIVRLGERLGVPWKLTWSCYAGGTVPCGRCDACRLRAKGFAAARVRDPTLRPWGSPRKRRTGSASPSG